MLLKKNKKIKIFFTSLIYFLYFITISFVTTTGTELNLSFLKNNIYNIDSILGTKNITLIVLMIILAILNSYALNFLLSNKIKKSRNNYSIYLSILLVLVFNQPNKYNNGLIMIVKSTYYQDKTISYYQKNVYDELINQSAENKIELNQEENKIDKKLPSYLDNIIILQLESLNSNLINEKNTPNFLKLKKDGMFFPKFYSNSVQTILAQESILCSLPSSFDLTLTKRGDDKKILCLPEVLKNNGFKNFFFHSYYNLNFDNTGEFMKNLSFDEVNSGNDISKKDDSQYQWGYRDDVFYKNTFAYLNKKMSEKNFIYLAVDSTNHWPFTTPDDSVNDVPYKTTTSFKEKIINTTYLQDKYLATAIEEINKSFPNKNYTLLILGDHSWPAEEHTENNFNQKYSYEENFLTSMIMIVGDEEKYKNKTINTRYSQMDIMPSILELGNINIPKNKFSNSFLSESNSNNPILLIQPYADKYISLIDYPEKIQYDGSSKKNILYNLNIDPEEKNGKEIKNNQDKITNHLLK